jgi:hypothetical protein
VIARRRTALVYPAIAPFAIVPFSIVPFAIVMVFTATAVSCTTRSASDVRAAAVYEGVVRWFAERRTDDPEPLPVFVEARGEGVSIDLAVQAELIELTAEYATARFIDAREEAIAEEEGDDGEVVPTVRDGGVLIRLDPVVAEGRPVMLDVDEYVDETTLRTLRFRLSARGDTWRVVGDPVEVVSP